MSERGYVGFTRQKLFQAAETVLAAVGKSRFALDDLSTPPAHTGRLITPACLLVAQSHNRLYVWSRDYWNVCLSDAGDGRTLMRVSATTQQVAGLLPQYLPPFRGDIPVLPNEGLTVAEEQLFFERIDLRLLGDVKPWLTCKDAHAHSRTGGAMAYLCRGGEIGPA